MSQLCQGPTLHHQLAFIFAECWLLIQMLSFQRNKYLDFMQYFMQHQYSIFDQCFQYFLIQLFNRRVQTQVSMKDSLMQIHSFIDQGQVDLRNGDLKGTKLHKFFKQLRTILAKLNSEFNFVNQSCINYKNQLYRLYQQFNGSSRNSKAFHSTINNFTQNNKYQHHENSKQSYFQKGQEQYGLHLPVNSRSGQRQSRQRKRDTQTQKTNQNYQNRKSTQNYQNRKSSQNYQNRSTDRDPSPLRNRNSVLDTNTNTKAVSYGQKNQNPLIQRESPYFEVINNDKVKQSRFSNKRNRLSSVDKDNLNQRNFGNSSNSRGSTWKISPARPATRLCSKTRKGDFQSQSKQIIRDSKNYMPMQYCNCQVNDVVNQVRQIKDKIDKMQYYCRKSMINQAQVKSPKQMKQMAKKVTKVYGLSREKTAEQLQILKRQMDGYIESIISLKKKAIDYLDKNIQKIRDRQERLPVYGKLTNNQYMMQRS